MATVVRDETTTIGGIYKGGIIIPERDIKLPEGTVVTITLSHQDLPPELHKEFVAWNSASEDAWKLIEEWEREEGVSPETLA